MRALPLFLLFCIPVAASAQPLRKPRLVVNVVVSQLRYDDLVRFSKNLPNDGFRRFMQEGMCFEESRYDYMQTNTAAGLATLTTGTNPSIHGVVGDRWIDFTTNHTVFLTEDANVRGLGAVPGTQRHSSIELTVPTLAERLQSENPQSKVVTVAADPVSAVVMGGQTALVFWMDTTQGRWTSSSGYMPALPEWVSKYNGESTYDPFQEYVWRPLYPRDIYQNTTYSVMDMEPERRFRFLEPNWFRSSKYRGRGPGSLFYIPPGVTLTCDFAREAIVREQLGQDEYPDILNVCFDIPRCVGRMFGPESMEYEDLFYRMDAELARLTEFVFAQIPRQDVLLVLTSDHGASDSYDRGGYARERFNPMQFRLIMNGFLNAQYGSGDWVIAYHDRQLYLNHTLIYTNNLKLDEVQNRAAAFALQFRGVSHVMTGTALQSGSFGGGYGRQIQNGYYPKRSGDLVVNLIPGWIEEDETVRSMSGSMYDYDTHVPLCWLGAGLPAQRVRAPVDMQDVAPTLARILGINRPEGATGRPIEAVVSLFE